MTSVPFDELVVQSLTTLAADMLDSNWCGKENEWGNLFTFNYLLCHCSPTGTLREPGQLAIEVEVGQPPGYTGAAVRRNIVIWPPRSRMSCWEDDGKPRDHPLAIIVWKVYWNRHYQEPREWKWLRDYSKWQTQSIGYGIEIDLKCSPATLTCCRFDAGNQQPEWLQFKGKAVRLCQRCNVATADRGEKYCTECREVVKVEMRETGYLQMVASSGSSRSSDMRENTHETKHGTEHG